MVLVDAGVELDHYCSDITRTWPVVVGGKEGEGEGFTERQGDVYDVVREVVAGCVRVCRSGVSMMELHSVGVAGLAAGLKKLGFVVCCFVVLLFCCFVVLLFCFVVLLFVVLLFVVCCFVV